MNKAMIMDAIEETKEALRLLNDALEVLRLAMDDEDSETD